MPNAQMQTFFENRGDAQFLTDLFLLSWEIDLMDAFPLFLLILKAVKKIRQDSAKMILVTLAW